MSLKLLDEEEGSITAKINRVVSSQVGVRKNQRKSVESGVRKFLMMMIWLTTWVEMESSAARLVKMAMEKEKTDGGRTELDGSNGNGKARYKEGSRGRYIVLTRPSKR